MTVLLVKRTRGLSWWGAKLVPVFGYSEVSYLVASKTVASEFDEAIALRSMGGDRELLNEIIDAFLDDCPRLTAALTAAILRGDVAAARRAAHTLKGNLSTLGAPEACSIAQQIETLAHEGACSLDTTHSDLLTSLSRLSPALAEFRRTQ
jgi:HPt (histidine-containing phosphotransfer) domain-containing protein